VGEKFISSPVNRENLYAMADNIFNYSNYEDLGQGVIRIKSSGKTLITGKAKKVEIQDAHGNVIHKFNSFNRCAKNLAISTPTVINRVRDGKTFLLSDQFVSIK
jgi:hypothetical protein